VKRLVDGNSTKSSAEKDDNSVRITDRLQFLLDFGVNLCVIRIFSSAVLSTHPEILLAATTSNILVSFEVLKY
jgi:hypothetical protein